MQIKLSEVIDAIDATNIDNSFVYYIQEERIISNDDLDEEDLNNYISLPSFKEKDDYHIMESFVYSLDEGEAKEWLIEAIKGKGAFRQFRFTVERFDLLNNWYDYRYEAYRELAIKWCDYYGVEYLQDNPYEKDEEEIKQIIKKDNEYRLVYINEDNMYGLAYLVKDFRIALAKLRNHTTNFDVDEAIEELKYYLDHNYPIYCISENGKYIGYCVCKIIDDCVWLESIYVIVEKRRLGVGKLLLEKAEELAKDYNCDTLYFNVHPNNDIMISFLKDSGYDVLNLIEIRKRFNNEKLDSEYTVGNNVFKY